MTQRLQVKENTMRARPCLEYFLKRDGWKSYILSQLKKSREQCGPASSIDRSVRELSAAPPAADGGCFIPPQPLNNKDVAHLWLGCWWIHYPIRHLTPALSTGTQETAIRAFAVHGLLATLFPTFKSQNLNSTYVSPCVYAAW